MKTYHTIFIQNNFICQCMHLPTTVTDMILSIHQPKRTEQQLYTDNNTERNINVSDRITYCMY
jgi:hypothetical protein